LTSLTIPSVEQTDADEYGSGSDHPKRTGFGCGPDSHRLKEDNHRLFISHASLNPLKEGLMQVPMLTAREELDIGEKTVAAEIDAYFR
jgi:hypothetical protein